MGGWAPIKPSWPKACKPLSFSLFLRHKAIRVFKELCYGNHLDPAPFKTKMYFVKLALQLCLGLALIGFSCTTVAESHGLIDCTHHHADTSSHQKPQKQDSPTKHLDCSCFSTSVILTQTQVPFAGSLQSDKTLGWKEKFSPETVSAPDLEPPRLN